MAGKEAVMWAYLRPKLKEAGLRAERITERLRGGVPDVVYVDGVSGTTGWVELKQLPDWPTGRVRRGLLHCADYRADQALWANHWARGGGIAGVLLRVGAGEVAHWVYWRAVADPRWATEVRHLGLGDAIRQADFVWDVPTALPIGLLANALTRARGK